jgi:hypothetical protein
MPNAIPATSATGALIMGQQHASNSIRNTILLTPSLFTTGPLNDLMIDIISKVVYKDK